MVGIGGGAPSVEHDIRLGYIAVNRPEGSHGGVINMIWVRLAKVAYFNVLGLLIAAKALAECAGPDEGKAGLYEDPRAILFTSRKQSGKNKRALKTFCRPDVKSDQLSSK